MVAENIDGNAVAARIRQRINSQIKKKQETSKRFKPALTIVQGE
jgi:methylenetetrahydrofolate dehydrogenase (NADP+)/methenyltetrahydrofolate cyclohydrolase/formyltetrahydrofolate synthetase